MAKSRKTVAKKAAKKPQVKKPMGRPSKYTPMLGDLICDDIANGESLRTICQTEELPDRTTIFKWLRDFPDFLIQYVRAREEAKWSMFEEMKSIAEDGTNDWMEDQYMRGKTPGWKVNGEAVQRSKLRIDTIKWQLSKLDPKVYGDKIENTGEQKIIVETRRYGNQDD